MAAMKIFNRRTFLSTGVSLLATGASFMVLPRSYAAPRGMFDDRGRAAGAAVAASPAQGGHHPDDEIKKCAQLCQDCQALCIETIQHCLKLGGRHAAPQHIGLLLDCAEICETTAHYLLRRSSLHDRICGICADVCRQCGDDCSHMAGDDEVLRQCVEMCRRCAESCERMRSNV